MSHSRFWFLVCSLSLTLGCNPAQCPDGFAMDAAGSCVFAPADAAPGSDGGIPGDGGPPGDGSIVVDGSVVDACVPTMESCNMRDDDCDGMTDEGAGPTYYLDDDGDGFGDPMRGAVACTMPPGRVTNATDCDDGDDAIAPGVTDACDGVDNDCSGEPDDGFACSVGDAVACTTSCGTTGSVTCTASCTVPTACAAPSELCNGRDEDCDGAIDEGSRTVGAATSLGVATGRIVTLPTSTGFISFYATAGGIRAQRLDRAGALSGSEVPVVTGSPPDAFDVTVAGSNYAVVYQRGTRATALLMSTSTLAATTSPTEFATFASATTHFELVASSSRLAAIYSDGTALQVVSRPIPSLGTARSTRFVGTTSQQFDAVASGPRAYVAYLLGTNIVMLGSFELADDAMYPLRATVASGSIERRSPALFVADVGTGVPQLGIAYDEPGAPLDSRVYLALYDVAVSGSVTARSTTSVLGLPPDGFTVPSGVVQSDGVDLVWSSGRWVVSAFQGATSSSWRFAELNGAGAITRSTVEATTSTNLSVSIAAGTDGSVLFTGARSGAAARAYLLGCGS